MLLFWFACARAWLFASCISSLPSASARSCLAAACSAASRHSFRSCARASSARAPASAASRSEAAARVSAAPSLACAPDSTRRAGCALWSAGMAVRARAAPLGARDTHTFYVGPRRSAHGTRIRST